MTLHWTDIALVVAIVAAGCGIIYFFLLRRLERIFAAGQHDMERRLAALTEAFSMHEPASDEAVPSTDSLESAEIEAEANLKAQETSASRGGEFHIGEQVASWASEVPQEDGRLPAEIQTVLSAAAIAVLGNHARIRSARRVPSSDVVSPWTQQGRVIVQSSHNLRTRG